MNSLIHMILGHNAGTLATPDRFTHDARQAISIASRECQDRAGTMVSVSDLLAGLGFAENTRAERVGSLKANASYLRWLICLPPLPVEHGASNAVQPDLDPELKKALAYAVLEADRDREYWIDSDHLLRGLLCFPNQADFALLKTELSLRRARELSRMDRQNIHPERNPNSKVANYLIRKHFALWVPPIISLACYIYILTQTFGMRVPILSR